MTSVSFRAVVESARGGGHVIDVDPDVAGKLDAKHRTRVRGTLDGTEYRSNLISMAGRLVLGVHKSHRRRYVGFITEAKRDERRARRVEDASRQMIEWAEERRRG
jgi:hypothetical protein